MDVNYPWSSANILSMDLSYPIGKFDFKAPV